MKIAHLSYAFEPNLSKERFEWSAGKFSKAWTTVKKND
jgi:hypothetical protein